MFWRNWGVSLIFLTLLMSACPLKAGAQTSPTSNQIAWLEGGALWWADENRPAQVLVAEGVTGALFSPQRTRLAYILVDSRLGVYDVTMGTPQALFAPQSLEADSLIGNLRWGDENTLWLNTFQNPRRDSASLLISDFAVWRVDVNLAEIRRMEGWTGIPTPDSRTGRVAVADPGVYGEQAGRLSFYAPDLRLLGTFDYPAVSSGSHLPWTPTLAWDEGGVHFLLPTSEAVYAFNPPFPPTAVLYVTTDGQASLRGNIECAFPPQMLWRDGDIATFSPEGALQIFEAATGTSRFISEANFFSGGRLLAWSQNGLYVAKTSGEIFIWDGTSLQSTPWLDVVPFQRLGQAMLGQREDGYFLATAFLPFPIVTGRANLPLLVGE